MLPTHIAVTATLPDLREKATQLAAQLKLPMVPPDDRQFAYHLLVTPDYIGIGKSDGSTSPLYIDFAAKNLAYRRQRATRKTEVIARALGLKHDTQPTILDATGGLGRDSFIIASLGYSVELLERSPLIYTLLHDAQQRGSMDPAIAEIMRRMQIHQGDTRKFLVNKQFELIYLDPMFPDRTKTALAKKDMQIFQALVGNDSDADQLLEQALACATKRVVVKRPRLANPLGGFKPAFALVGSSSRFDVYLP